MRTLLKLGIIGLILLFCTCVPEGDGSPRARVRYTGTVTIGAVNQRLEREVMLPDDDDRYVITGIGVRERGDDTRALMIEYGYIDDDNRIVDRDVELVGRGSRRQLDLELITEGQEVVTGVALTVRDKAFVHLGVYYQRLDPATGQLTGVTEYKSVGSQGGSAEVDRDLSDISPQTILTGIGLTITGSDVAVLALHHGEVYTE